jgi:hypothetical protein
VQRFLVYCVESCICLLHKIQFICLYLYLNLIKYLELIGIICLQRLQYGNLTNDFRLILIIYSNDKQLHMHHVNTILMHTVHHPRPYLYVRVCVLCVFTGVAVCLIGFLITRGQKTLAPTFPTGMQFEWIRTLRCIAHKVAIVEILSIIMHAAFWN